MGAPTILIVDDAVENIRILKSLLQDMGQIVFSLDGAGALRQAEDRRPDVILLDVMMPGIDGIETCRRLKSAEATRDIPVIFTTGADGGGDRAAGLAAGAAGYLVKPYDPAAVRALVGGHLGLAAATAAPRG